MVPDPRHALERAKAPPPGGVAPDERTGTADEAGRVLVCVRCGHAITTAAARVARAGRHEHTFANPHGYVFRIGCFGSAPGCAAASGPSTTFTWFPGHAWQVAACRGCDEHVGWSFSGPERFFGLILDRLVETDES